MNAHQAPRAIGLPLDAASAAQRARQIAVLTDPVRLRVLSAIATSGESLAVERIAALLETADTEVARAIADLQDAGLVSEDALDRPQLTADAWVRFGRLVAPAPATPPAPPRAVSADELPPIAATIARDLAYRFHSVFSAETVTRYVAESYALLAERAKVTQHLASLTTRFATDRLTALATAEGLVLRGTPEVLFVCVQNAGRSQIASALLRHLAGDRVHVRTAGSAPASVVHPDIVNVLDEIGVPIAAEFPKPLTDEVVQAADFVVTMGCGDACPIYPGRRYMDWELDDPLGLPLDEQRRIRDEIRDRVLRLIDEMRLVPAV